MKKQYTYQPREQILHSMYKRYGMNVFNRQLELSESISLQATMYVNDQMCEPILVEVLDSLRTHLATRICLFTGVR